MKRKKIVYLDDVNFHLFSTKERLKHHFEVYPAQTLEIFYQILENITPDLLLLDINMPGGIDGFTVVESLKSDPRCADIPFIFVTARDDKYAVQRAMSLGAADFVVKPYNITKLIECIEAQLGSDTEEEQNSNKAEIEDYALLKESNLIILAVDDSPSFLQEVNHVLQDTYNVHTLANPEELSEVLKTLKPDLFLLDYKMPKLNGFELIPIIRGFPEHEETPILFLSSEGKADIISLAIKKGVCDFIIKPINGEVLRKKIAMHIKGFMKRRSTRKP